MHKPLDLLLSLRQEAKDIFEIILKKGPITKGDILDITKMKLSTLNRVMLPLEVDGLIVEASIGESSGGRKPVLFDINTRSYYLIGVDISRTYTQMVVTDLKSNVYYQEQFIMDEASTPKRIVNSINEFVNSIMLKLSINKDRLIGIGIGTVGPLDRVSGTILNPRRFLTDDWYNVPIKQMVEDITGVPVTIDNGANTAALSEYIYGAGKGISNIAYINCGVGIRTGAISNGMIVRTINDAEDAFGHMVVDIDGEQCCCGNYGCIECYSSIPSIVNKFISEIKKGRVSAVKPEPDKINYMDICNAADNGDKLAQEIIINAGTILGVGLANYINLLNPKLVILSGPLIKHCKLFYETCTNVAAKKCFLKGNSNLMFSRGGFFQDNAISIGASASIIEEII